MQNMKHREKFQTSLETSGKILSGIWYYWCHVHDLIFKERLDGTKRYENASTFACNVRRHIRSSFSQVNFLGSNLAVIELHSEIPTSCWPVNVFEDTDSSG
jgi:hypothetical protein